MEMHCKGMYEMFPLFSVRYFWIVGKILVSEEDDFLQNQQK